MPATRPWLAPLLHKSPAGGGYVPALDGLRGFAVLIVLLSHGAVFGMRLVPSLSMGGTGHSGVVLFFVLSSFLLTSQMMAQTKKYGLLNPVMWFTFLARRGLRIYPAYAVFLAFLYITHGAFHPWQITWDRVVAHLTMVEGGYHLWSIPVEFHFYLVMPLVIVAFVTILRRSVAGIVAAVMTVVVGYGALGGADDRDGLTTYLQIFAIGMGVAVVHARWRSTAMRDSAALSWLLDLVGLASLCFYVLSIPTIWSHLVGHHVSLHYWDAHQLTMGLVWAAGLFAILNGRGYVRAVFEWQGLKLLGVISFSFYLWHLVVIHTLDPYTWLTPPGRLGIAFVVSAVIASASYLLVEHPLLSLRLPRPRPAGTPARFAVPNPRRGSDEEAMSTSSAAT